MRHFKIILIPALACLLVSPVFAQTDSTKATADTIKIGGMVIIKKGNGKGNDHTTSVTLGNKRKQKGGNISTSEMIIDLGFANWSDKTDYATATSQHYLVNRPGQPALNSSDLRLRTGKSSNVNIWFFMQRLNLVKHYVNLKYGIGLETNNYRFSSPISFKESGANPYDPPSSSFTIAHPFIFRDSISFKKDKLSTDYVTVPIMLNFRSNPDNSDKSISASAGVSIGYLYNSRNKQISSERGKHKNHGDYNLKSWKFSYLGELGLGKVRLYGSYSPNSIFDGIFNIMPYTIGVRLSNW